MKDDTAVAPARTGTAREVFLAFLQLGLTSFGGPIAHLGYFRHELVIRRRWLSEAEYADLVALCQFLPGPASSQVGFAIGLRRAGWPGALAAFAGFTLPSAVALLVFAMTTAAISGPIAEGVLSGLKIVAVAIVAQAVLAMARTFCPDRGHATIAAVAVAAMALLPGALGMAGAIAIGALIGLLLPSPPPRAHPGHVAMAVPTWQGAVAIGVFVLLFLGLPMLAPSWPEFAIIDGFYRAGSMVFGGGHVVLPLLQAEVVATGWMSEDQFLAGYGAAQAVPGPLFTVAAYLGAVSAPAPNQVAGAALALTGLFLPGFLILIGALPFWDHLRAQPRARLAMQGANAAVVGVLGAALYSPVFTGSVHSMGEFALALTCFVALVAWNARPWIVVVAAAIGGIALALAG